jgi:hypothetical protein
MQGVKNRISLKPVLLRLSLAGNLENPLMSFYWTKWLWTMGPPNPDWYCVSGLRSNGTEKKFKDKSDPSLSKIPLYLLRYPPYIK